MKAPLSAVLKKILPAPLPEPPFLLRDLTLPEEIQKLVKERCRGYWFARSRREIEDGIKLGHFFGGQTMFMRTTPEGRLIVFFGHLDSEEFQARLQSMTRQEFCQGILYAPTPLNDDNGITYMG